MTVIEKWFDQGCDYAKGIIIYSQLPKHNPTLLKNFQRKNNSFNSEKLKYELKKFIEKYKQIEIVADIKQSIDEIVNPVPQRTEDPDKKNSVLFHQLPEALRPVLLEANNLFKENCMLKVSLNELPQHAERQAIDIQIKIYRNIQKNALCWSRIDYFIANRIIPESTKSDFEKLTPAGLLRQQQLLYASISKLNTRLNANLEIVKKASSVPEKSKIERLISKQQENLLNKNEQLIEITNLIDGK
ncbi:hypothetical protein GJU43_14950 [Flavobacterium sp. LC2016-23]|uniref:hypothetical protein n=1 Tax=Flavobacterium sp. LC2016-23 TaxID=2666330 RepID=UPI0012AF184C|nr:hypothetical protein [Flavobacterium sp. LC2016-23]MRX40585.1 hypothetical protein [Flavobacterium sp. LC2016-23]